VPPRRRGPICSATNLDLCLTPGILSMRDAWDVSRPFVIERKRGFQGPISLAEGGQVVLAQAGGQGLPRVASRTKTKIYDELNIVGSFPFKGDRWKNDAEIRAALLRDNWFPADQELGLFANSKRPKKNTELKKTPDAYSFLNALFSFPAKRVNLFIHGTSLSGDVKKGNVIFKPGEEYDLLGEWLDKAKEPEFRFEGNKKLRTIRDLQKTMPSGAKLIVYGCNSGSEIGFLNQLANLLKIKVQGFSQSIRYYPVPKDGQKITSWTYSHGASKPVDDYHKLTPDRPPEKKSNKE
jgi:hypothetical protein